MNHHHHHHHHHRRNSSIIVTTVLYFILILIPSFFCQEDDEQYQSCSHPYTCGKLRDIMYPFWGNGRPQFCGLEGFELRCVDNNTSIIESGSQAFRVLEINYFDRIMTVIRHDLVNNNESCPLISPTGITEINETQLQYDARNVRFLDFFYDCDDEISSENRNFFNCSTEEREIIGFYTISNDTYRNTQLRNLSNLCKTVTTRVAVSIAAFDGRLGLTRDLRGALEQGFDVRYNASNESCYQCKNSGGICGSDRSNSNRFVCICPDQPNYSPSCPPPPPLPPAAPAGGLGQNTNAKIGIAVGGFIIGGLGVAGTTIICIIISRRKSKNMKNDKDLEAFIQHYGSLAPKRYNFSEVKKMTNSFKEKLGQGGFGHVYKGEMSNGQLVAVKLLNTSKGNGQDFVNEVASISRTSHVNIVTLVGFCIEGNKRILIYEFMPNGSLEKFIIHKKGINSETNGNLGVEKLYQIALGIARGLEYLHRGCNTRIVHFDIKPHNILLDEEFCPKISDFGLAKLANGKESIMSMLEARGTIGYITPEVFNRNFGGVSYKSDVYSYGMMILEMVGVRKKADVGGESESDAYFPDLIYKQIHAGEGDGGLKLLMVDMNKEEYEMIRKMVIVALWCIQIHPSSRPCINKVIEMLQASSEDLQIPPKPSLSSPPRPPIDSSTITASMSL